MLYIWQNTAIQLHRVHFLLRIRIKSTHILAHRNEAALGIQKRLITKQQRYIMTLFHRQTQAVHVVDQIIVKVMHVLFALNQRRRSITIIVFKSHSVGFPFPIHPNIESTSLQFLQVQRIIVVFHLAVSAIFAVFLLHLMLVFFVYMFCFLSLSQRLFSALVLDQRRRKHDIVLLEVVSKRLVSVCDDDAWIVLAVFAPIETEYDVEEIREMYINIPAELQPIRSVQRMKRFHPFMHAVNEQVVYMLLVVLQDVVVVVVVQILCGVADNAKVRRLVFVLRLFQWFEVGRVFEVIFVQNR
mmetsp:Transcript_35904/g.57717  ORF Transcript_35904/g.57717 Transcript_35904/m.57717 type:complete len:299 (+) Transcript_35904:157-1053(+)